MYCRTSWSSKPLGYWALRMLLTEPNAAFSSLKMTLVPSTLELISLMTWGLFNCRISLASFCKSNFISLTLDKYRYYGIKIAMTLSMTLEGGTEGAVKCKKETYRDDSEDFIEVFGWDILQGVNLGKCPLGRSRGRIGANP